MGFPVLPPPGTTPVCKCLVSEMPFTTRSPPPNVAVVPSASVIVKEDGFSTILAPSWKMHTSYGLLFSVGTESENNVGIAYASFSE